MFHGSVSRECYSKIAAGLGPVLVLLGVALGETFQTGSLAAAAPEVSKDPVDSFPPGAEGQPLLLEGKTRDVTSIAFSPDGKTVIALCPGLNGLKAWDTASGKLQQHPWKPESGCAAGFSPDGKKLAVAGQGRNALKVMDAEEVLWRRTVVGLPFQQLQFLPDGKTLAARRNLYAVDLFDVDTGKLKLSLESNRLDGNYAFALSPDGKTFARIGSGTVGLWHGATGKLERILADDKRDIKDILSAREYFVAVAFAAEGTEVIALRLPNLLESWDTKTGKAKPTLKIADWSKDRYPEKVAFSPDGREMATQHGKVVEVRDTQTGKRRQSFSAKSPVDGIAYSWDGKMLAVSAMGDGITIWKVAK